MVKVMLSGVVALAAAAALAAAVLEAPRASASATYPVVEPLVLRPMPRSTVATPGARAPAARAQPAPLEAAVDTPSAEKQETRAVGAEAPAPAGAAALDAGAPTPMATPAPIPSPAPTPGPAPVSTRAPRPPTVGAKPEPAPRTAPPAGEGVLNLEASGTADVYVDGKKVGTSPVVGVKARAGAHKVRFDCYDAAGNAVTGEVKAITLAPGEELDVEYTCAEVHE